MANLDATTAAIGFLVNGAGLTTQRVLLERDELKEVKKELSAAIGTQLSQPQYVERLRGKLCSQLKGWVLVLHLLNLGIYAAVITFLVAGPETISQHVITLPISPLTPTARILLYVWLGLSGITYLALCFGPTVRYLKLIRKASQWMRDNEMKNRKGK